MQSIAASLQQALAERDRRALSSSLHKFAKIVVNNECTVLVDVRIEELLQLRDLVREAEKVLTQNSYWQKIRAIFVPSYKKKIADEQRTLHFCCSELMNFINQEISKKFLAKINEYEAPLSGDKVQEQFVTIQEMRDQEDIEFNVEDLQFLRGKTLGLEPVDEKTAITHLFGRTEFTPLEVFEFKEVQRASDLKDYFKLKLRTSIQEGMALGEVIAHLKNQHYVFGSFSMTKPVHPNKMIKEFSIPTSIQEHLNKKGWTSDKRLDLQGVEECVDSIADFLTRDVIRSVKNLRLVEETDWELVA